MYRRIGVIILILVLWASPRAQADDMKIFIKSCTYGILVGTLVGAASLAFTSQPGENLNNIARGASLGLYTGIAIGYLAVRTPSEDAPADGENPENQEDEGDESVRLKPMLSPLISSRGFEGAEVGLRLTF